MQILLYILVGLVVLALIIYAINTMILDPKLKRLIIVLAIVILIVLILYWMKVFT